MSIENEMAQTLYLTMGGPYQMALQRKIKSGEISQNYEYREYPKMLYISQGIVAVDRSTETCKGKTIEWVERKERFTEIVVNSEDEEERVLSGGKTTAQVEADRQALIVRGRALGLKIDESWSAIRLRRELGDNLNNSDIADEMKVLVQKRAHLQEIAAMRAEIAALEAQLAKPADDPDDLRAQLSALGVTPDKRWGAVRLREELERATAPQEAA